MITSEGPERLDRGATVAVIPCFNEEVAVASVVLRSRRFVDEVVVIDDGSTDRTVEVAEAAGARVIRHSGNLGKSEAVWTAIELARKEGWGQMVLLDGDGQHDPAEIPAMLHALDSGADLALGFRVGEASGMPGWRRFGKRVLDYATAAGGGGSVTDSQCGFRALGRRAIEQVDLGYDPGFGAESEMIIQANRLGLVMQNVRVTCRYDGLDTSTKNPVSHGFAVINSVVKVAGESHPLLIFGVPGLVLFLLGVYLGYTGARFYQTTGTFPMASAFTAATAMMLGSLSMFAGLTLNVVQRFMVRNRRTGARR